jgi:hypothetical protein
MVPAEMREQAFAVIAGLFAGPIMALVSPLWVFSEISRVLEEAFSKEDRQRREAIKKNLLFNYGTVTSLRDALSGGVYGHYFQSMDGDLYSKLLEREILDSLVEFLDAHGIETSDLKERQTTILNTGVMVQGGDVKAESLAVGTGARAAKRVRSAIGGMSAAKGAGQ